MSRGRKGKADPSTIGLNSSQVEGQGTTTTETGSMEVPSSRKKQKRY
ncbi:YuzL family protein [Neobacillus drentensis]